MSLIIEESKDASVELLTQLLASVKKDIMPIGKRLGEKVFADSASKLKPYLTQAVKSLDLSLHGYSKVVTSILEGTTIVVEHSSDHTLKNQLTVGSKAATASSHESSQACGSFVVLFFWDIKFEKLAGLLTRIVDFPGKFFGAHFVQHNGAVAIINLLFYQRAEDSQKHVCSEDVSHAVNTSPKSITSNGSRTRNGGISVQIKSVKETEHHGPSNQPATAKDTSKSETNDPHSGESVKS
nr:uncharacterized protein LOC109174619 isoform X3 [Ipomoea trifida]